jgi:hypothetical protein
MGPICSSPYYGTDMFVTVLWDRYVRHRVQSCHSYPPTVRRIHCTLFNSVSLRLILILSSHLLLDLPKLFMYFIFPSHLYTNYIFSGACYIPTPCHPTCFNTICRRMQAVDITVWISQREPTRCDRVVEFIIQMFLNCSACFGRLTAHHQELRNCKYSLWFYIRFWLPAAAMAEPSQRQPVNKNVCKTRGCNYRFWAPDDGRCVARNMLSN